MCAAARASRKKRDRTPGVCATFRSITFSATVEFRTVSRARYVIAMAPAPSSTGNPSAPTSTSKWSYFSGPGVNRRPVWDFSGCWLSLRKPRLMRQRRHSPCVSGPPQVGQVSVNAIDLFNSGRRSKSIPRLITPAPSPRVEPFPFDVPTAAGCRSAISSPTLMLSGFDRDNEALDRHRPDQKLCSPLPSLALRDNADANAKARYAASLRGLQVSPPLLLDLAASVRCRQRMALAPRAIRLSLPPQTHFAHVARRVSRYSKPRLGRNRANRSDEQSPSLMLRLRADVRRSTRFDDRRLV